MSEVSKTTGTFKSFDGTPIYYEVRGEGKPLVLCYGIACPMNHWIHQTRHFSKHYQVILFDYRGHHQTPSPTELENLSIDAIVQDMHLLLQHLGLKTASFWGHSYGAQLLLRAYELYPEMFDNFILINGFATNPLKGMFGLDVVEKIVPLVKAGMVSYSGLISKIWKMGVTNPLAIPLTALAGGFNLSLTKIKDIEVYAQGVAAMDLNVFLHLLEQMMEYDGRPVLPEIKVPTLIISGDKDGVTPPSYQQHLHEMIAGSEIQRVPYGSHCTQLDMPDFVNLRIDKFLAAHDYPPTA
jgi:pimeloyl-ACP methyl ester carboxylesterase